MLQAQHIHPIIVHFPIVFIVTLVAFDAITSLRGIPVTGRSPAGNVSAGLAVLAAIGAVIAFHFGGVALDFAEAGGFSSDIAEIHEGLGETTAIALAIWAAIRGFLWFRDIKLASPLSLLVPLVEIAGFALVLATAYYGGQLVYDLGVNVAHAAAG